MWIAALTVVGFTLYAFYAWAFLIRHRVRISILERDYYDLEERRSRLLMELEETKTNEQGEFRKELERVELEFERVRNAYNEEVERFNRKLKSPVFFIPAKLFGERPIDKMD